jgi:hypothetical protein
VKADKLMLISGVLYGRCLLAPAADSGLCAFSGIIGCSSPKLRKSQRYAATSGEALHSYPATRFARIPPASGGRPLELAQKQDIAGSSAASSRRPLAARFAQMAISHKSKNGPGGITSPYGVSH